MGRFLLGITYGVGASKAHLIAFYVAAMRSLWTTFGVTALGHAMAIHHSPQVFSVWRLAVATMIWLIWDQRNMCLFDGVSASHSRACAHFWALMREADGGSLGCMRNSTFDLSILSSFGITGRASKAPSVICLR
ncbi:hypothetical protein ACS0TY_003265 [Phlomoides rotata]